MWRELWRLLKASAREWWKDDTFRLASSLAFYTIFSLAPVLLIAIYLVERVLSTWNAAAAIAGQVSALVGDDGGRVIEQIARNAQTFRGDAWTVIAGVSTLLFGSTVFFAELQAALNQIWGVKPDPRRGVVLRLVRDRVLSFAMAVSIGFLLLVSLVLSAALHALQAYMGGLLPGWGVAWQISNTILSVALSTALFALIYKILPDAKIRWSDVWIGALATAVLFAVGKYLIGAYLGRVALGSAYGAAGSFVVFLIWIYYSALICFYGAEFTQVYARRHGGRIEPKEGAVLRGEEPRSPAAGSGAGG
ncbi:hypothetical protein SOCE26_063560 [Sorangium cellulosum]|uniref:Uncharacterized protein n=1 Tax=Sorangium cellulosum TaxID=56 RepID=A0A2L0F029_SORCE|nr:YihY/virulence factor BrkB family protein [Sorangium cellulosum]AUX44886.1 hypothetical protein SOCE26_063560 [Sorangium cellulosum]